jgi:transposase-like protein
MGRCEWTSALVLPYQRRLREVNEAMLATSLVGGNTRRLRGALANLLKAARSPAAASRASRGGALRRILEQWQQRPLADLAIV